MKKIATVLCLLILLMFCGCTPAKSAKNAADSSTPQNSECFSSANNPESKTELPEASPQLLGLLSCQNDDAPGYIGADVNAVIYNDSGKEIPFPDEFKNTISFGEVFPAFFIGENYYYFAAPEPQSGTPVLYYVSESGSIKNALDIHPDNLSASKTTLCLVNENEGFILQEEDGGYSLYHFTEKGASTEKIHTFETGLTINLSEIKFISEEIGFICGYSKATGGKYGALLYRTDDGGENWQEVNLFLDGYDVDYENSSVSDLRFIKNFGILRMFVWSGDRNAALSEKEAFAWQTDSSQNGISFYRFGGGKSIVFFTEDYGESWLPLFSELMSSPLPENLSGIIR